MTPEVRNRCSHATRELIQQCQRTSHCSHAMRELIMRKVYCYGLLARRRRKFFEDIYIDLKRKSFVLEVHIAIRMKENDTGG